AGKTSLLRTVCGNLAPFKGDIVLKGKKIATRTRSDLARQMAVVRQNQAPMPIKVQPYVLLGRLPFFKPFQFFESRKDLDLARHFMSVTGILDLADSAMDQISGGERQLAALARALTQEPEILVLDEPTAHLDITHQARILDLISGLRDHLGLTVLMVIHDLNLAAEYSDELVLLNKERGRIHAMGTPEEILTRENILAVYHTPVRVEKNPKSGRPCIFIDRAYACCNSL
ncbi:MAG: ABC transporter ATP-binding protein, partial [Desulfobacterales bacterium]|nr:ABC transporter ATP-binding protein [Desulfobacterales bacterium]